MHRENDQRESKEKQLAGLWENEELTGPGYNAAI